jgi:dTDP-4-dehydrorhamnose reductase
MRLLLTGAEGHLGQAFVVAAGQRKNMDLIAFSRSGLDITNPEDIERAIKQQSPDMVINTAAYTDVDGAEIEPAKAYEVNQLGPANLARQCAANNIPLIHFSTDYVFDGSLQSGWKETDTPAPLNIYGASKLAGEQEIIIACRKYLIFRTSWLFSAYGSNFLKSMLQLGRQRSELNIVDDQFGKPTSAPAVADLVLDILPNVKSRWGLYHLAQPEATSWFGFAQSIFTEAENQGISSILRQVNPIKSVDYPADAARPGNSALCCEKIEAAFGLAIKPWRQSLPQIIGAVT